METSIISILIGNKPIHTSKTHHHSLKKKKYQKRYSAELSHSFTIQK